MINLIYEKVTEIELKNNINSVTGEINIELTHEYNVSYSSDNKRCLSILRIGMQSKDKPELLTILCTVAGEFDIDEIQSEEEKKQIHVETYRHLFPYGRTLLAHLCTEAQLPPFYFPQMNMTTEDVRLT